MAARYKRITTEAGALFFEDAVMKTIYSYEDEAPEKLPATPDAFYKFRTDIAKIISIKTLPFTPP